MGCVLKRSGCRFLMLSDTGRVSCFGQLVVICGECGVSFHVATCCCAQNGHTTCPAASRCENWPLYSVGALRLSTRRLSGVVFRSMSWSGWSVFRAVKIASMGSSVCVMSLCVLYLASSRLRVGAWTATGGCQVQPCAGFASVAVIVHVWNGVM